MSLDDVIETLEWAERHFGSLVTNRQCPRRDVMRAVKHGLAESVGRVTPCDDDGFSRDDRREREGFRLTAAGRARLADIQAAWRAEFLAAFPVAAEVTLSGAST